MLVGRPSDPTFKADLRSLEEAMEAARGKLSFPNGSDDHRRGTYLHVSAGISYGGGPKVSDPAGHPRTAQCSRTPQRPGDLQVGSALNRAAIQDLEGHRGAKRLAGFVKSTCPTLRAPPHSACDR